MPQCAGGHKKSGHTSPTMDVLQNRPCMHDVGVLSDAHSKFTKMLTVRQLQRQMPSPSTG